MEDGDTLYITIIYHLEHEVILQLVITESVSIIEKGKSISCNLMLLYNIIIMFFNGISVNTTF